MSRDRARTWAYDTVGRMGIEVRFIHWLPYDVPACRVNPFGVNEVRRMYAGGWRPASVICFYTQDDDGEWEGIRCGPAGTAEISRLWFADSILAFFAGMDPQHVREADRNHWTEASRRFIMARRNSQPSKCKYINS